MVHKYSKVGRCIYCGVTAAEKNLSDEHIIPFALNGALILPDASCENCANITHRYEHTVARGVFGHFRIQHKVQSRHPKKRPTHITVGTLMPDGTRGKVNVPLHELPTMLFVYKFDQATMLRGFPLEVEDFRWAPISIFSKKELDDFIAKHHWDRQTQFLTVPVEFARMLAKIAYSFAVGEFGIDSFRPLQQTIDIILNRTSNVSYSVGGDWEISAPDPEGVHILTPIVLTTTGGALIIVEIRLFPAFETPQYRVVVGEFDFQNPQHAKKFAEKMQTATKLE